MGLPVASVPVWASVPAVVLFTALSVFSGPAEAQRRERAGKEVIDAACGSCHVSGKDGAPRIGDAAAWAARTGQGLTMLTEHALKGIRKMPAHGGSTGVSDLELQRAIVYMVNNSGGRWIEPAAVRTSQLTSEAIVRQQCAACHQSGKDGAPKIGDRAAWTPRFAKGLDRLVASAVHGHGAMPARGGMPDLERDDIRHATLYMFNYGLPAVTPPAPAVAADPHHKLVAGLDVYFGMMRADALRSQGGTVGGTRLSIPSGRGYYHLNISVEDNRTHAPVTDAQVTMQVSDGMTVETRTLERLAANNAVSYGNFFKFTSGNSYNITTEIKRAGAASPVTAKFEFKAP